MSDLQDSQEIKEYMKEHAVTKFAKGSPISVPRLFQPYILMQGCRTPVVLQSLCVSLLEHI